MCKLLKSNGWLGNFDEDSTLVLFYSTVDKNGGRFDLSSDTTPDVECYKNETQTPITDGILETYNINGITGLNRVVIDLSVSASFVTGADYMITRIDSTIDTETVNALLGFFSIENRYTG
jgi:hypothetical protein